MNARPATPPMSHHSIPYVCVLTCMFSGEARPSETQESGHGRLESTRLSVLKNELDHGNRTGLERFWAETGGNAPLIEKFPNDEGLLLITFLWRGGPNISSVLLQGGPPTQPSKWLSRLPDTDLWFRTDPIPQDARFTYGYEVRTNQNISRPNQFIRREYRPGWVD